jgi:hypothetical protein
MYETDEYEYEELLAERREAKKNNRYYAQGDPEAPDHEDDDEEGVMIDCSDMPEGATHKNQKTGGWYRYEDGSGAYSKGCWYKASAGGCLWTKMKMGKAALSELFELPVGKSKAAFGSRGGRAMIDCSDMPEGATHWCAGDGNHVKNYWYRFDKDIFWFCSKDGKAWERLALTIPRQAQLVELSKYTDVVSDGGLDPRNSALDVQVGGGHYKSYAIQPVEFIHKNKIPYIEGCAIKYLCRWREKGGVEDLKKARHYLDLLIEMEVES